MKIKDFQFDWLMCPNCQSLDIEQERKGTSRMMYCDKCGLLIQEDFIMKVRIGKQEKGMLIREGDIPKSAIPMA